MHWRVAICVKSHLLGQKSLFFFLKPITAFNFYWSLFLTLGIKRKCYCFYLQFWLFSQSRISKLKIWRSVEILISFLFISCNCASSSHFSEGKKTQKCTIKTIDIRIITRIWKLKFLFLLFFLILNVALTVSAVI